MISCSETFNQTWFEVQKCLIKCDETFRNVQPNMMSCSEIQYETFRTFFIKCDEYSSLFEWACIAYFYLENSVQNPICSVIKTFMHYFTENVARENVGLWHCILKSFWIAHCSKIRHKHSFLIILFDKILPKKVPNLVHNLSDYFEMHFTHRINNP